MTAPISLITAISPAESAGSNVLAPSDSNDLSLEKKMLNALAGLAEKSTTAETGFAQQLNDAGGDPKALLAFQREVARYTLQMQLLSTGVRKATATVETLLKA
jgi:hypothetical protein